MSDLRSKKLIVAKGAMFSAIAAMSMFLLFDQSPTIKTACLVAILAWSSSRFYYFLFYVLEKYVDPDLKYAGLIAMATELVNRSSGDSRWKGKM